MLKMGFPGSSAGKESACNSGDSSSIPGLGRSPGKGNGYPLQYSCLENSNFTCKFFQYSRIILHRTVYFNLHNALKGSLTVF